MLPGILLACYVIGTSSCPGRDARYAALERWARASGANISHVGIAGSMATEGGELQQQVLAIRSGVKEGGLLLSVPFNICMSSNWVADPLLALPSVTTESHKSLENIPAFWKLALRLLVHKRRASDSPFAPYISALPEEHGLPFDWHKSGSALNWAHGTGALKLIRAQRNQLDLASRTYAMTFARSLIGGGDTFTPAELAWAAAMVWSRAYSYDTGTEDGGSDGRQVFTFVPVLDMANHRPRHLPRQERERFVVRDIEQRRRFVYAPRALSAGEEYLHDYGALSNEQLFTLWGFVPRETNPDDSIEVWIDLNAVEATAEARQALLQEGGISKLEQTAVGPLQLFQAGLSPGLIALHRLALVRGPDERARAHLAASGRAISILNEGRVRSVLTAACEARLAKLAPGGMERLAALNNLLPGSLSAEDRRLLMVLRLAKSKRELLVHNLAMFAALEQEAIAGLKQGSHAEL